MNDEKNTTDILNAQGLPPHLFLSETQQIADRVFVGLRRRSWGTRHTKNGGKIELKNIKVHIGLSEETFAYTAVVWFRGKKAVEVSNTGQGGCDCQYAVNGGSLNDLEWWCNKNLAKSETPKSYVEQGMPFETYDTTLEHWCADQVGKYLEIRDFKRAMKARPVYVDDGKLWDMKFKGSRKYSIAQGLRVKIKHPDAIILNDMDADQAFELWEKYRS